MNGWMHAWMYGCIDVWMYGCMDVWMYGCMDVWMYGCMHAGMYIYHECSSAATFVSSGDVKMHTPRILASMVHYFSLHYCAFFLQHMDIAIVFSPQDGNAGGFTGQCSPA